jgi:hypothetical protein
MELLSGICGRPDRYSAQLPQKVTWLKQSICHSYRSTDAAQSTRFINELSAGRAWHEI